RVHKCGNKYLTCCRTMNLVTVIYPRNTRETTRGLIRYPARNTGGPGYQMRSIRRFGDETLLAPLVEYRLDMLGRILDCLLRRLLAASDISHHFSQQMLAVNLANGRIGI